MMTHPSRLNFWRLVMIITLPLAGLAVWDIFNLAETLGISPFSSKTWLVLLGTLALAVVLSLLSVGLSFTHGREKLLAGLESVEKIPGSLRWIGWLVLLPALATYTLIMFHPYYGGLLAGLGWLRMFLLWVFGLLGMQALKLISPGKGWTPALLAAILLQAVVYRVAVYLPAISAYPFAMGWSETSRYYYPALFIGQRVFGQAQAWPILHPSLHLLLVPPYLLDAPLWFHRFWQVAVRFGMVGLIAPALIQRLKIEDRTLRWLAGAWIFLYLFIIPLYLHLAVPVLMILWGFSIKNGRRTWFWLVLASIWAGLSRLNWYPVPGMLAAGLYFLEVPLEGKGWRYLFKPALWSIGGTLIAYFSMQVYIALSAISYAGDFFTSLSSTKLWYRLWPNGSYSLGVFPAVVIFSMPLWLGIFLESRQHTLLRSTPEPASQLKLGLARAGLLVGMLAVLFAGGLLVSTKIGGGADIHNMDAYAVLLLVVFGYVFFGRHVLENGDRAGKQKWNWSILALLVFVPAWFALGGSAGFWQYDPLKSQATIGALQQEVDEVNAQGGQILFITQRHLISMHMLMNVKLVPEYEREELMEMAMAQNEVYLQAFRADVEKHRFAAIVVDPLRFNLVGEQDSMGAENNAWARFVAKRILCNYRQAAIFPDDHVAIYTPQVGTSACP